jgi:hypothetical protein
MSTWTGVLLTCAGCYLLKVVGLLLPARLLTPLRPIAEALPVALLAALVAVSTLGQGQALVVDARVAGVAVGAVLVWRRAPMLAVIVASGATAALLRALS